MKKSARQNTDKIRERGHFNISLKAVNDYMGSHSPEDTQRHTEYIIDPILNAITEIEETQKNNELKITPVYKLLLKAIECISLMTGDKVFYDMNKDYLQTIYGILGEPAAIEIEKQEVEQRLKRLMAAYEQEQPADAKQRIKNAIRAHQEKLEKLQ